VRATLSNYDVVILGGGASGLMCAIAAAKRQRRVIVLEKANKPGKKILMSGGGRCNFTNLYIDANNYVSGNPHFCKSALSRFTQWDFIAMIDAYGIEFEERKYGQLFCKHSAKEILNMLLNECDQEGIVLKTQVDIDTINPVVANSDSDTDQTSGRKKRFRLSFHQGKHRLNIECQSLIVATGALSIPSLGGSGMGYDIAEQFSHSLNARSAGLVPFMFSDAILPLCQRLSGLALDVEAQCNGVTFTESLLFTHRGMSGPVMLQLSNYWCPGEAITLNLLPSLNAEEWLLSAKISQATSKIKTLLQSQFPKNLVNELQLLWWPDCVDYSLTQFSDTKLIKIGKNLNSWILKPSSTEGYRTAEVTLGGIDTKDISSKTMESKIQPGLYFIGEVLDVTGHLGGFNFQWAWSSGYAAGLDA